MSNYITAMAAFWLGHVNNKIIDLQNNVYLPENHIQQPDGKKKKNKNIVENTLIDLEFTTRTRNLMIDLGLLIGENDRRSYVIESIKDNLDYYAANKEAFVKHSVPEIAELCQKIVNIAEAVLTRPEFDIIVKINEQA